MKYYVVSCDLSVFMPRMADPYKVRHEHHTFFVFDEDDLREQSVVFRNKMRDFPNEMKMFAWTYRQLKEAGLI